MAKSNLITDDDLFIEWVSRYQAGTARCYLLDMREFRTDVRKAWSRITTDDIAHYLDNLDRTPGVLRRKVAAFHGFFQFATDCGLVARNVAASYRNRWPEPQRELEVLTVPQIEKIIRAAANKREYLIVALAYYGNLSGGEIAGLTRQDIDTEHDCLVIKTGHRKQRIVDLPHHIITAIQEYWIDTTKKTNALVVPSLSVRQNIVAAIQQRRKQKPEIVSKSPAFPSRKGRGLEAISVRQICRIVTDVARRAGIATSIHVLRNSHARHVIQRGASLAEVQISLGHQTTRSTARHFTAARGLRSRTGLLLGIE